jgi:hypothetical protein
LKGLSWDVFDYCIMQQENLNGFLLHEIIIFDRYRTKEIQICGLYPQYLFTYEFYFLTLD